MSGKVVISKYWPTAVLLACGLGALAVLVGGYFAPSEPSYAGKPLTVWLNQLDGLDPGQAQMAIRGIGPKAIPVLWEKVRQENSRSQRCYRAVWSKLPYFLERILPVPQPDAKLHPRIVAALRLLEARGLPTLIAALDDPDSNVRLLAISTISSLGPQASAAVPSLIHRVNDSNPDIRAAAVLAFRYMGPDKAQAVPALTRAIQDDAVAHPDAKSMLQVREAAAQVLGKIGSPARPAVPALSKLLLDSNPYLRQQATLALWRIEHDTSLVELATREAVSAREPLVCKRFLEVLGEMGTAARPSVGAIVSLMTNAPAHWQASGTDISATARAALRRIDPRVLNGFPP